MIIFGVRTNFTTRGRRLPACVGDIVAAVLVGQRVVPRLRNFFAIRLLLISICVLQSASCSRSTHHEPAEHQESPQDAAEQPPPIAAVEKQPDPYRDVPDGEPVIHRNLAGEPGDDGWCTAESTRGNFSIELPGKFVDSMIKSRTTTGGTGVMHTVGTIASDGTEFNALQMEILGERPEGSAAEQMIERFKNLGVTVTEENVRVTDVPAVRLHTKGPGVAAEFLLFRSSNNDYMLAVQSRQAKVDEEKLKADADRFFQSFKIRSAEN